MKLRVFTLFKSIQGFGPENLPQQFIHQFKNILSVPRGAGYWIWRPFLLYSKLNELKENEFIVYLDAGCKLNKQGLDKFYEYIKLLNDSEYGVLSFQMSGNHGPGGLEREKYWTTSQIFKYFNIDTQSDIANSGQYLGGVLILKKNKHLMKLMDLYIKALVDHPLMFTDFYNHTQQHPEFRDNRHDQSIFSLIRKIHGSVVIDGDESWMVPFGQGESLKYPFWATRSKT